MSQLTTFKSRRNGNTLVIENHLFNLAKENKNGSSRWYCKYRKNKSVLCKVVVVTFGSCIVESIDGEHNHPAYNDANYKKPFMQFQNKDMIGFSSPTGLEILNQSEWWAADGTFQVFIYLYLGLFQRQI